MEPEKKYKIWLVEGRKKKMVEVTEESSPMDFFPFHKRDRYRFFLDGKEIGYGTPFRRTAIQDGSELKAVLEGRPPFGSFPDPRELRVLYGCPGAQDVPGTVPDSMATEFQGFSDSEV